MSVAGTGYRDDDGDDDQSSLGKHVKGLTSFVAGCKRSGVYINMHYPRVEAWTKRGTGAQKKNQRKWSEEDDDTVTPRRCYCRRGRVFALVGPSTACRQFPGSQGFRRFKASRYPWAVSAFRGKTGTTPSAPSSLFISSQFTSRISHLTCPVVAAPARILRLALGETRPQAATMVSIGVVSQLGSSHHQPLRLAATNTLW
ncbi:hypothetical protein B0H66DRAFT_533583 [Apodospora peruviana]|uniref:Uncharacterized protein n=1 Tax=Apodospora peruviana TaxID=516989 RepID=A0AAE0I684_9PEZI|nr:hypothetical protein B0H66DRAFT_533583 [Apodospora peruviana]